MPMKTLIHTLFLFVLATNIYARPLSQQEAGTIISEAVLALESSKLSDDASLNYKDAYWEDAIAIIFEYPELTEQIFAATNAEEGLIKAVTKEIKWLEFICSHTRYNRKYSNVARYQNIMTRLSQHSFREKGQHTIRDTLQSGCNRIIYEGDNPATLRVNTRIMPPKPPSGS